MQCILFPLNKPEDLKKKSQLKIGGITSIVLQEWLISVITSGILTKKGTSLLESHSESSERNRANEEEQTKIGVEKFSETHW